MVQQVDSAKSTESNAKFVIKSANVDMRANVIACQYYSDIMDFPVPHLWGWWMFFFSFSFRVTASLFQDGFKLGLLFLLPDVVCIYFNDNQYICE